MSETDYFDNVNRCLLNIKAGRREYVDELHGLIGGALRHVALSILQNSDRADDVLQDFWADIYDIASKYRYTTSAFSYLKTCLRNKVINEYNSGKRKKEYEVHYVDYDTFPSKPPTVEDSLENVMIKMALGKLPDEQRVVFELYFFQKCTVREIAKYLKMSKSKADRIRQKAIEAMKNMLK